MLNKFVMAAAVATALAAPVAAQERVTTGVGTPGNVQTLTTIPPGMGTVTNWYKQDVYDPSNNKIGQIGDVLVNKDAKVEGFIVSVGGFLGIGEKDVAVPFNSIHETEKNGKPYLTMNATKDSLKNAVGFKYDKNTATWVHA